MSKFEVTITKSEIYTLNIEAKDEDEAIEKADELLIKNKDKYHNDSDDKAIAYEVT